jgi:glutathione S-transferase
MSELILHHYASSPFSEKVRLVLGMKGLRWKSVDIPVMMPKPDVVALTGGYRRTPFMQIGADIYCDSALMCRVVDRLQPEPALYPDEAGGIAHMVAQWADSALFWVAVPMTIQINGPVGIFPQATAEFLKAFGADRASMTAGVRRPGLHDTRVQLSTCLGWVEQQLGDGRPFVLGSLPCIADFSIAQSVWFMHLAAKVAALLQPYPKLLAWHGRMKAFGHGTHDELSSTEALAIAAAAPSTAACSVDPALGIDAGAEVTVNALDYGADPVVGTLVGLSQDEVVLARRDERAGRVHVHFPRIGFQVKVEKKQ